MSSSYLLQRRREARLRRFGLVLGGILALAFHLALFWGPKVGYRPLLEQVRVRRVLVARPYQPAAPPQATPPRPVPAPKPTPKPAPKLLEPSKAGVSPPPAPKRAIGTDPERRIAKVPETVPEAMQARAKGTDDITRQPAPLGKDAWTQLLGDLEDRKDDIQQEWQARREEIAGDAAKIDASQTTWGAGGEDENGEGYLDSRIRMTVVSYPPTSIEADYPSIPYPDLRFRRAQLEKGTCRVWYRVWTDGRGEIVRTQVKTPSTEEERALYSEFVTQVEESVAEWPFPRQEAEVHIDVFFQIE